MMRTEPESKSIDLSFVMQERAVLYARVSGDDRRTATSGIDSQLADGRKYAGEKGYKIVGEFYETPESHTSGAEWLPEIEKVLGLVKRQKFDVLIVREIDRLARNRFKQMSIENHLNMYGARVEYVKGQYEDTPEGKLLKGLMGEFAEFERNKITERLTRGIIRSVEAGNVTIGGSNAPYGYDVVKINGKRVLVINEQEAAVVRLIFDMFVNQRMSLHGMADYLDNHNIPKPVKGNNHRKRSNKERVKGWSVGTLNGMLGNETYVGHWYYRKTKYVKNPKTGKPKRVPRPREEWVMIEVPAIINEDIFRAAQERRDFNKRQMGKNRKNIYLLGGMCKCGHCGNGASSITKVQGDRQWGYYKCNAHHLPKRYGFKCENSVQFRVEAVENAVWKWIKTILIDEDYLDECLDQYEERYMESKRPIVDMIAANRAKLTGLEEEKDRLIKGYRAGVFTLDEIAKEKVEIDKQITDTEKAISELEGELGPQRLTPEDKDKIKTLAAKVRKGANLADKKPDIKRKLFEMLHVEVSLIYEDNKRWADVSCILGEEHLPTDNTTLDCNDFAWPQSGSNRVGRPGPRLS